MSAKRQRAKIIPIHAPKRAPVHPFDQRYGTETSGLIPRRNLLTGHANDAHITAYYGVAPSIQEGLIDLWLQSKPRLGIERYTFLDIGAGKGRAMMVAARHPFLEVVGIELNSEMAKIARANVTLFKESNEALAPLRIIEDDALEAPLPDGPTLAFLFHPFEAPVLRKLMKRVESHWSGRAAASEALFDLLYVNAEHAAVLDESVRFARIFYGPVAMSAEDHLADLAEIAEQEEYGSTGDEICGIYRLEPREPEMRTAKKRAERRIELG